ncbi:MAG: S-layer homology domain-containing protein, partial [Clostridia bacterium]|nr:S-layer homology domain-containing protein [Clostridia bacterium]
TTFGPDENITREQICAMMVRYCNFADIDLKEKNAAITFKDAGKISKYARAAVKACQMGGIVNGEQVAGGFNFRPQGNASRAEVATIMMNFAKEYKDTASDPNQPPIDLEIGVGPGELPPEDENW